MLTITNLIRESLSFFLLLSGLQVKGIRQRHDTLQTKHKARILQNFQIQAKRTNTYKRKIQYKTNIKIKLALRITTQNTQRWLNFTDH